MLVCYPKISMARGAGIRRVSVSRMVGIQHENWESRLWLKWSPTRWSRILFALGNNVCTLLLCVWHAFPIHCRQPRSLRKGMQHCESRDLHPAVWYLCGSRSVRVKYLLIRLSKHDDGSCGNGLKVNTRWSSCSNEMFVVSLIWRIKAVRGPMVPHFTF